MSSPQPTSAIELRHVALSFDQKRVLSDISFQLEPGGTILLLGVAGTGKSVLLKLVLGLFKPDSGEILVNGQDVTPLSESELGPIRKQMGIVFQEGALFDSLSVFENVAYPLLEAGETNEEIIERRVREVLGFVEMEHAMDKMPAELSGGMKRRVAIARAIANQPNIMLYDSPTGGLDPVTAHTITTLMARLRDANQVSSVVVTHRLQDGYVLANFVYSPDRQGLVAVPVDSGPDGVPAIRFIVLRDGGIYFQGSAQELAAGRDPYLRRFLE